MKRNIKELIDTDYDFDIKGITDDSRNVKEGFVFVATKGYNVDHFDFVDDAINNGCSIVISDRKVDKNIPNIVVDKINFVFSSLCKKFYDINLEDFNFIGITGTDGKTTTSSVVKELIDGFAYIGTNGISVVDKTFSTSNTTPCISELYNDLKIIKDNNCTNISMEVSSEALLHNRVSDFKFNIVGFTNITGDHLNIHKTMDEYFKCKRKLIDFVKDDGIVIVNKDDKYLQNINCKNMYTYGFDENSDFFIFNDKYCDSFTSFSVKYNGKVYDIVSPLKCKYNVYNVCLAFAIALLYGVDSDVIISRIKNLKPISGRCEFLDFGQEFSIVLDYAHTTNGIKSIIESFKNYKDIIVVTGCAGGREKEKRAIIGEYIVNNCNTAIFTMDDPRFESVDSIINDMCFDSSKFIKINDRREAINYALKIAKEDSVVLILGKGRDNYMAIEDKKIPYCDYDVIKDYFG